jgi:glycosyltransferase involved in cell wall biosynthesis
MNGTSETFALLSRNSRSYEDLAFLTSGLRADGRADTVLECIAALATFASRHHPGRFADGRVENIAWEIGRRLERTAGEEGVPGTPFELPPGAAGSRRRVLHVASAVRTTGGHTRTILNWVRLDRESQHTLLLTGQGPFDVPPRLAEAVSEGHGGLIVFPTGARWSAKALWLRAVARSGFSLVVLHHFPDDVTPTVAFAGEDCPPVALLNHTDHHFWLGSTAADVVVNLRGVGQALSEERRFTRANAVLPIPLTDPLLEQSRAAARAALGIPADRMMLLSVGRAEKYTPTETHNFYATAAKILDQHPEASLYLLGVSEAEAREQSGGSVHGRLYPLGPLDDAAAYQLAADVYLEGFPFGSSTALLEATLAGVPAVPAFAPAFELIATHDDALTDLLRTPADEGEYIAAVSQFIRDAEVRRRVGAECRERLLNSHTGAGWLERLERVYRQVEATAHRPGPIPEARCLFTETDSALSAWQESRLAREPEADARQFVRGLVFGAAYRARQWGDYRGAWHLLGRSLRLWGRDGRTVSALAKLVPHWICRRFATEPRLARAAS